MIISDLTFGMTIVAFFILGLLLGKYVINDEGE